MKDEKDNQYNLEPEAPSPSSNTKPNVKSKLSDLEQEANIKTKVGIETAGNFLSEEQKAKLQNIVNLSHKREIDKFEPDGDIISEIITNKNKELSDREISEFNNSMAKLDPARDELNDYVDKFNQKAKELGADKIINNKSLSEKDKKEQLDKLFEENPEFAEIREKMIEKQMYYRNIHKKIESIMNNFIEKNGKLPQNIIDRQKEIEDHQKDVKQPEPGLSDIGDKLAQSLIAIGKKIKKCFNKILGRENKNETEGVHVNKNKNKITRPNFPEMD